MPCISPVYLRSKKMFVPCGKCNFCLDRKRKEWSWRLNQEKLFSLSSVFITLTYADAPISSWSGKPTLCKSDVQKFFKRLRKRQSKLLAGLPVVYRSRLFDLENVPIRYYTVGEYGSKGRPHYHAIVFNLIPQVISEVSLIWGHGFTEVGQVEPASVNYVTGYILTRPAEMGEEVCKPFALITNRSGGLGLKYLQTHRRWHYETRSFFIPDGKRKVPLPRIYRERIFSESQRARYVAELQSGISEQEIARILDFSRFHPDPWAYELEVREQANRRLGERFSKLKTESML